MATDKSWKQRSTAIETIEQMLTEAIHKRETQLGFGGRMNKEVQVKRQQDQDFFSGGFMEFLVPLIDDVNFKVCLTTMNMVTKMLVLDVIILDDLLFQQLG